VTAVAVIGAGAAGLVTAVELRAAGHDVVVFEQSDEVGGVWVYDEAPGRTMYDSLRTNLPRDLMAFRSYPFDSRGGGEDHWPRFPGHRQVLEYLQRFAVAHDVTTITEFGTAVTAVAEAEAGWSIETVAETGTTAREFGAVAVCNGHFTTRRAPPLAGTDVFPGETLHSRDYRRPDRFAGKRVVVIGTGSSGFDLSVEVAAVAEQVVWCGQGFEGIVAFPGVANLTTAPLPDHLTGDGHLVTAGERLRVDVVLWCTGFHYDLAFIDGDVVAGVDAPAPLYRHLMPLGHPTMALIGIPQRIIPFPLFEMQAKWFAAVLTGAVSLPSPADQAAWLEDWQRHCRATHRAPHQYRNIGEEQFDYVDDLARECAADVLPDWYRPLADEVHRSRLTHPLDYRDRPLTARGDSRLAP